MTLNTVPAPTADTSSPNRYLQILDEAWTKHLAPRSEDASTVISTFAGCGGSSLGYSIAGYRELLAVEWDNNAVETFRLNFPDVPVYHGDIAKLSIDQCLEMTGLKPGELDVLDGSPPCQGFSMAGKRVIDDPRNQLFREYVRLLRGLQPKVFVMENVSGMVKGKMKLVFVEILKELKASGYQVSARLLNAKYFHVPQSRVRMIFIGMRDDLGIMPSHPKAESAGITVKEAWIDLNISDDIRLLNDVIQQYAKVHPVNLWSTLPDRYKRIKGNLGSSLNLKWASWDSPVMTIIKDERALCGIVHPSRERYLTISEIQRCGSFPDQFQFIDKRKQKVKCIGNSVPPLFMEAIARHIRQGILNHLHPVREL